MKPLGRMRILLPLAAYLLATTGIHFLHDHGGAHDSCGCLGGCVVRLDSHSHAHSGAQAAGETASHEDGEEGAPGDHCEDTCLACQFLAVKSIAPAVVAVVERVEIARMPEEARAIRIPSMRPSAPLSRGPPRV